MNVFELVATLTLDSSGFDAETSNAKNKAVKLGDSIKKGLKGVAVATGAVIAATGAAAVAAGKKALESYADYEQLAGGIETLFGDAASAVMENSSKAYKTAGLSANDYMETVTSFSASLIQSLGGDTEKAASYADMAITDMSDNANKMGSSMDSIQAAYQGFAKQNYTMLDNLKLGYGGTKTEMERLITDAEKLDSSFKASRDKNKKLTMSYSDIVDAIHIVQTNMGITGTTAQEAASTISGSVSATKAAWSNLITGIADDNADMGQLIDDFVESALTAADNIIPRIGVIMDGLGQLISTALPQILPIIVQVITDNLPMIIESGMQIMIAIITGLIEAIPQLIAALPEIFTAIVNTFVENWPAMKAAGMQLLTMLAEGIASALGAAVEFIRGKLSEWVAAASEKVTEFGNRIQEGFMALVGQVGGWVNDNIITPMKDAIAVMVGVGASIVDQLLSGIKGAWSNLTSWVTNAWNRIKSIFTVTPVINQPTTKGAIGFDYIPSNNFPMLLHRGEAVLTAREAEEWRRGGSGGGGVINLNQYIQTVPQTPVELAAATEAAFVEARWAV